MKAFPTSQSERYPQIIEGGMDLRDYFAAKALQGMLASHDPNKYWVPSEVAKAAYMTADAMMEARK